jgi:hypothetical protein
VTITGQSLFGIVSSPRVNHGKVLLAGGQLKYGGFTPTCML